MTRIKCVFRSYLDLKLLVIRRVYLICIYSKSPFPYGFIIARERNQFHPANISFGWGSIIAHFYEGADKKGFVRVIHYRLNKKVCGLFFYLPRTFRLPDH